MSFIELFDNDHFFNNIKAIFLIFCIDLSVNGHPESARQNDQLYDQYYYYDDEYYYADELATGTRKQQPTAPSNPRAKASEETKDDSLSDAKEAIAQYDIDELVKAWREYMEEKEDKEKKKETPPPRYSNYVFRFNLYFFSNSIIKMR